jgi:hypothetical protein
MLDDVALRGGPRGTTPWRIVGAERCPEPGVHLAGPLSEATPRSTGSMNDVRDSPESRTIFGDGGFGLDQGWG